MGARSTRKSAEGPSGVTSWLLLDEALLGLQQPMHHQQPCLAAAMTTWLPNDLTLRTCHEVGA
jgi:hypothetical protein